MKYRKVGRTDIEVSVVCHGCWSIISDATWGPQDEADSIAAIRASLDAGVNFFDTAELYGNGASEELLGRALKKVRDRVVLASKALPQHLMPAELKSACENSLKRLRTDRIDLYQIHWPNPDVPLADTIGAMEELRASGKIGCAAVANFGTSYLREALAAGRVESNQLCYSLLWRPIEYEVRPLCVEQDVGILCYSPLCQGLLTGKFASPDEVPESRARTRLFSGSRPRARHGQAGCEDEAFAALGEIRRVCDQAGVGMCQASLAWLLAQSGVASVTCGARNARQARENAGAGDVELSGELIQRLAVATEKVKTCAGTNADFWMSTSRMEREFVR